MPAVAAAAALSAVVAGSTITAAGALAIGFSWAAFAGSLVLGAVSYALTPKPKKPSFTSTGPTNSTVAVRQSDLTRQYVYGHTRITRGYAHMQSTGLNGMLHAIMVLCEGPLRSINEVWVNDYCIPNDHIDENGLVVQGRYANHLVIRKHLGEANQSADTRAISEMPEWTSAHRLQGVAYVYLIMAKNQDIFPTGVPNFSAVVEGPTVYDPRVDAQRWTTNMALLSSDFLRSEKYGFGAYEDDVDYTNFSAQANICDEIVDTAPVDSDAYNINTTLNTFSFSGNILLYQFGDRVEVIASSPPGGISTGTDYYVIPYQIKDEPRIQFATSLENAMNKVAVDITSTGSGTITVRKTGEPRYHGSGQFDTETNLSETLNNLVSSMAGRAINIGGFWTLIAGAWRTPILDLGQGDVRGSGIGFKNSLSMSDSFNVVKGLFVSSLNNYQSSDYPSARYETFIQEDNDLESSKDINLPFTNRPTTAQRIAKIELFRGRQDIVVTADFSTRALQIQPGDVVTLTFDWLGWDEKEFEVTQFNLDINNGSMITRLSLRETAQEIYDWSQGEAIDYDPARNTNLPDPFLVFAVTGVRYNSRVIDTRDGDEIYTLGLDWNPHPDAFVTEDGDFEIQYKLSSESEWRPSFFVDGKQTHTDALNSSVNIAYDLRIRARNSLGVRSAWTTILNAIVGSSGGVGFTLDWGLVTEDPPDFTEDWGFVYETPATTFNDWEYVI